MAKVVISLLSLVSLSLGVTNLLPIPALDGGKILLLIISIICLFGCSNKPDDNKPWDDLGGGGSGEQTEESDITTGDVDKKDEVEDPNKEMFETIIEGAITINLNSLISESEYYLYNDKIEEVWWTSNLSNSNKVS